MVLSRDLGEPADANVRVLELGTDPIRMASGDHESGAVLREEPGEQAVGDRRGRVLDEVAYAFLEFQEPTRWRRIGATPVD